MTTTEKLAAKIEKARMRKALIDSVNAPKSELMRVADHLVVISPRKALALNKLIAKIESWQNAK